MHWVWVPWAFQFSWSNIWCLLPDSASSARTPVSASPTSPAPWPHQSMSLSGMLLTISALINPAFYKLNNFIIEIVEQFLQLWSANHCNCHPQLSSKVGWKHLNKKSSAQLLQSSHSLPDGSLYSSGMSKTFLAAIASLAISSLAISSLVIASLVIVLSDFIDGHWVLWLRVARVWLYQLSRLLLHFTHHSTNHTKKLIKKNSQFRLIEH